MKNVLPVSMAIILISFGTWFYLKWPWAKSYQEIIQSPKTQEEKRIAAYALLLPLENALSRVVKKPFNIYITPRNSPVSPEKFTGWHTGADFEIFKGEENKDITIFVICSGKILRREQARGYGGMVIQECTIQKQLMTVVYGHLKLESIKANIGDYMAQGVTLGTLGKGGTKETDFERKHLHLSIHKGTKVDSRGYVSTETELTNWIDPMILLKQQ